LKARLVTASVLIALFASALLFASPRAWRLLTLLVLLYAAWEWSSFARLQTIVRVAYVALIGVIATALLAYATAQEQLSVGQVWLPWFTIAALFWFIAAPAWLLFGWAPQQRVLLAATGVLVLVPTWLAMVALRELSPYALLHVMALVWVADSVAYFVGRRYGKHKLAPAISPGKTWEGVLGGFAGVAIYLMLSVLIVIGTRAFGSSLPLPFFVIVVLGAPLTVASIIGDLFESWMKRQAGLKDSGSLLPGHGGVLDRIDALTATLPVAAAAVFAAPYFARG
jgi:phosphatidate cytidylyltransferase